MTTEEYKQYFQQMRTEFPGVKEIEVYYQGSAGSRDDMYVQQVDGSYDKADDKYSDFIEKYDDLLERALLHSGANFRDDGCSGTIVLDLDYETIVTDNEEYFTESRSTGIVELNAESTIGPTRDEILRQQYEVSRAEQEDDQIIK